MLQPDRHVGREEMYGILNSMQEEAFESSNMHRDALGQQWFIIEQLAEHALEQNSHNHLSLLVLEAIVHWVKKLMKQSKLRKEVLTPQGRLNKEVAYEKFIAENQTAQFRQFDAPPRQSFVHGLSECLKPFTSAEIFSTLSVELRETLKKIVQALFISDLTPSCIKDVQVDEDGKVKALQVNPSQIKAVNQKSRPGFLPFAKGVIPIDKPQQLIISLRQPTSEPIRLSIKEMQIKMRQASLDQGIIEYLISVPDQLKNLLDLAPTIGHIGVARQIKQSYQAA